MTQALQQRQARPHRTLSQAQAQPSPAQPASPAQPQPQPLASSRSGRSPLKQAACSTLRPRGDASAISSMNSEVRPGSGLSRPDHTTASLLVRAIALPHAPCLAPFSSRPLFFPLSATRRQNDNRDQRTARAPDPSSFSCPSKDVPAPHQPKTSPDRAYWVWFGPVFGPETLIHRFCPHARLLKPSPCPAPGRCRCRCR